MLPSTSMASGLRQPQSYSTTSNTTTRLPQLDTTPNRGRRQSVISASNNKTSPQPRSRTMSDASRPDPSLINRQPLKDRRSELRRSLYIEQPADDDSDDEETNHPKYRISTPLLDTYGVPLSPARAAARSNQQQSTPTSNFINLPPSDLNQKIRVCVRKRPLSKKELDKADKDVAPLNGTRSLQINEPK